MLAIPFAEPVFPIMDLILPTAHTCPSCKIP